ncbi:PREDICTED: protein held out wings-like [Priapulus caudatus]|uniref:Protein held out wings-like n=1 Tax=Priapulus caudatus TaxID=37621 RepID=A0ABM1F6D3_PRICU|nr:PREDICTED: protein held out wings-like [Priapulus caudatus]
MSGSSSPNVAMAAHHVNSADYLAQLLKDRKQIAAFPAVFIHLERLLDEEINKVRLSLFHLNGVKDEPLNLPEATGPVVTASEKVYVPVKEFPDFNFVGRILGPRGMTAKQLEQDTGCKIMVRGKGSMRDKKKEEANRGKANWEHLSEDLHVLITCEDTEERSKIKLQRAMVCIKKLLVPSADGEDDLKKSQLIELAMLNGTYRDENSLKRQHSQMQQLAGMQQMQPREFGPSDASHLLGGTYLMETPRLMSPHNVAMQSQQMRSSGQVGAPLILQPRPQLTPGGAAAGTHLIAHGGMSGMPPPLISPVDTSTGLPQFVYPFDYHPYLTQTPTNLLEGYHTLDQNAVTLGAIAKQRRHLAGMRDHPYPRQVSMQ